MGKKNFFFFKTETRCKWNSIKRELDSIYLKKKKKERAVPIDSMDWKAWTKQRKKMQCKFFSLHSKAKKA